MSITQIILLGLLILIILIAVAYRKKLAAVWLSTKKFFREVKIELQKVTWPSQNEIIGSTIAVLIAVIALAVIITLWDSLLSYCIRILIPGQGA